VRDTVERALGSHIAGARDSCSLDGLTRTLRGARCRAQRARLSPRCMQWHDFLALVILSLRMEYWSTRHGTTCQSPGHPGAHQALMT